MMLTTTALTLLAALSPGPSSDGTVWRFENPILWDEDTGPPAREHAAFVVDAARDRALLVAGSGYAPYGTPLGDAWALDLEAATWRELRVTGDPLPPGGARRAAPIADGDARAFLLHGGYGAGLREVEGLWWVTATEDALAVRRLHETNPPPARMLHGFAADATGETLVAYGGVGGNAGLDDTWIGEREGDSVVWRRLETATSPGGRLGFAYALDGTRFLVCGGQRTVEGAAMVVARDLWELDVAADAPTWKQLATYDESTLPGRRNPAFAFDAVSGDLLIWGGTGDGRTALPHLYAVATREPGHPVTRIDQPAELEPRASCFAVVDEARGRVLLGFGNHARGPVLDLASVRRVVADRDDPPK